VDGKGGAVGGGGQADERAVGGSRFRLRAGLMADGEPLDASDVVIIIIN